MEYPLIFEKGIIAVDCLDYISCVFKGLCVLILLFFLKAAVVCAEFVDSGSRRMAEVMVTSALYEGVPLLRSS